MPTTTPKLPVTPSNLTPGDYVLGTGMDEAVRLGLQHRLWSAATHELWEKAAVQPGQTVIDIGCGPGHATLDLAQIVGPTGRVIAIDESATFLKQLHDAAVSRKALHIERVLGDVQDISEVLAGEEGTADVAYARWVFCFLERPEGVVQGLAKVLKPGGRLAVQDYFNYERALTLAPRREAFSRVISAVAASWRARGGDTDIMGRLPGMLQANGFRVDHIGVVQRIARPGSSLWHWPNSFWQTFVPKLVEGGFISREDKEAFDAAWDEASHDPASFIQLPPVYELVATRL
jgi:ubiquinone/menaquinone biosynthesis C-methylase UbiE